jgi:hypothetical protein
VNWVYFGESELSTSIMKADVTAENNPAYSHRDINLTRKRKKEKGLTKVKVVFKSPSHPFIESRSY